jgi:sialidase-1
MFERIMMVKRQSEYEHHGPPFMQQLPSGEIIANGGRQLSTPQDQAVWRDAGRTVTRYAVRSSDGGRTWEEDLGIRVGQVVDRTTGETFSHDVLGTENGAVAGAVDRTTGEMFSLRPTGTPMVTDEGKPMTEAWFIQNWQKARDMGRRMVLSRNSDGGRTWTAVDVTDQFYNYPGAGLAWFIGHGIQLQRGPRAGRLLIPGRYFGAEWEPFDTDAHNVIRHSGGAGWVYEENGVHVSEILNEHAHNCVAYSDDHGQTWHWGGSSQGYAGESCIVELSDGSVYINNRNHDPKTLGYRSWAVSRDGGETFTEFGVDETLVEGRCHASLARYNYPEGDEPGRILFLNPAVYDNVRQDPAPRHHMTVRISYDDSATWPVSKCLWEGPGGYSDMIVLTDGTILCGFEVSKSGFPRDEVMLCRFNMAWLESDA